MGTPSPPTPPDLAAVCRALAATGHTWLQRVTVHAEGECVVLRGAVPSFYLKQVAQVTALAVPGIETLRNELRVAPRTPSLPARPSATDERDPHGGAEQQ